MDERSSSELDALLQRAILDEEEGEPKAPSHRKSYSIGLGSTTAPPRRPSRRGLHRKQLSSISQLYQSVRNLDLEPIREDFQQTIESLKMTFIEDLDHMDRGETGFFDMSLTRSLSVIPADITDFGHEAGMTPKARNEQQGPPIFQFFMLLGAVAGISSNSTALHMLDGVHPPMKLYWRMTASYCALTPMAVRYFIKDGFPELSFSTWLTFVAAVLGYSIQNILFYSSLEYTTIGNAVIYANSQALLLIIGKACVGERIHILEGCGVFVAFSGALLCSKDSASTSREENLSSAIFGDLLALGSAVVGVGYLTFAKAVRPYMSVTVLIWSVMFVGSFVVLAFIHFDSSETLEWNMNPNDGVFGWLDLHRLPILIFLAVVCNMIGTMGFVRGKFLFFCMMVQMILPANMSHHPCAHLQQSHGVFR
jgi:drug/metabolite transporter (DMT)-like permease